MVSNRLAARVAPEGPHSARAQLFSPVLAMKKDARQAGWSQVFSNSLCLKRQLEVVLLATSCFDMGFFP